MKILCVFALLLISCQKQQDKDRPRPLAAYDQALLATIYQQAATKDEVFLEFKRDPIFNLTQENVSDEEGERLLNWIVEKAPDLLAHIDKLRQFDQIGSPRLYRYEKMGLFSPTTLRYLAFGGKIREAIGDWEGKKVVQIGGGYGGLCSVLGQLQTVKGYTIIDTRAALQLTERYLRACRIEGVELIAIEELKENLIADLVLSDGAFFECSQPIQNLLLNKVLSHASSGFLFGRQLPKHYRVVPYGPREIRKKLGQKGIEGVVAMDESFPSLSSFNLFWKKSSFCED